MIRHVVMWNVAGTTGGERTARHHADYATE